jgi:hypothetical protein
LALRLAQTGYQRDDAGGVSLVPGGSADVAQQKQRQQFDFLTQRVKNTERALALADSDSALQEFVTDGDANVFQSALNKNENLRNVWKSRGVQGVSNIDWQNDKALVAQAGFGAEQMDTEEDRKALSREYFKVFTGREHKIVSAESLMKQTGILQRLNTKKRDILLDHFSKSKRRQHVNALESKINTYTEVYGISRKEALDKIEQKFRGDPAFSARRQATQERADAVGITYFEQLISDEEREEKRYQENLAIKQQRLGIARDRLSQAEELSESKRQFAEKRLEVTKYRATPTAMKLLNEANKVRTKIHAAAGGEDSFYEMDFDDANNYRKFAPLVKALEVAGKVSLSTNDIKDIKELSTQIQAASVAKDLSSAQVGPIGSSMHKVKQFLTDNLSGVAASAAFATYKNIKGHALFGAAFTPNEQSRLDAQLGTLGNQVGPVLAKFKVSLEHDRAKLKAIQRLNDPIVLKFRLGVDANKLDRIIESITERLSWMEGYEGRAKAGASQQKPVDLNTFNFYAPPR